ncbi:MULTISPECIES: hypothetical protein [Chryseobacterium]|uniref:hypothetical protein n=1 Tax=Chryseobacterium sp. R2A-55 TaxID=2744445 RepID=UPI001F3612EF|nr:hypothetical protein [Chryseobacterium sp. R2A-55]
MKKTKYAFCLGIFVLVLSCKKTETDYNNNGWAFDSAAAVIDSAAAVADNYQINNDSAIAEPIEVAEPQNNKYLDNSLQTGATPYSKYYGKNSSCDDNGCSQIKVKTPYNSDVLVTIKKNNEVVRHAYIKANDSFTFSFPNGNYQAFFYYGKGWNPEKEMKNGAIKGGFVADESFGKDDEQSLYNNILSYELILQPNGNFSTSPSNPEEAL